VVTDGMGLNITVMSYCGELHFGIVADREQMPDLWSLTEWLREAVDELRPASPEPAPTAPAPAAADATAAAPTAAEPARGSPRGR
jgi:hypothetical protein